MKKGKAHARISYSSKPGDSPKNSTYKEHLKKELKSNIEKARSIKKDKVIEPISEVMDSSITSFTKKLISNRTTPRAGEENDKAKFSSSKSKIEVQGKIDFINSMFEELTLGEKPKPKEKLSRTLNMDQPISKDIMSESVSSVKNQNKSTKHPNSRRESEQIKSNQKLQTPTSDNDEEQLEEEEVQEKPSKQKKSKRVLEDVTNYPKKLFAKTLDREAQSHTEPDEEVPRTKSQTVKAEPVPVSHSSSHSKSKSMHNTQEVLPHEEDGEEEEQSIPKGSNSRRKSAGLPQPQGIKRDSKPPLPNKKEEEQYEDPSPFSRYSDRFCGSDSFDPSKKNYIEINKELSTATKKIHKNYEKILMNFDQSIKPVISALKGRQTPGSTLKGRTSPTQSRRSPRPTQNSPDHSSRAASQPNISPSHSASRKGSDFNFSNPAFDMQLFFSGNDLFFS